MTAGIPTRDEAAVRRFLTSLLDDVCGPVPLFGHSEWTTATDGARLASFARWALLVLDEESPEVLAARLASEVREDRRAQREASCAIAAAEDWRTVASEVAANRAARIHRGAA